MVSTVDVAIVGAGIVGACTAHFLERLDPALSVLLIERDRSFARASSALSASSIRQQFSVSLNIRLSRFGLSFLREMGIALHEGGYLYLGARDTLAPLHRLQRELKARFPWLNVADLEAGSLGLSGEGWFDGPALHAALLRRLRAPVVQAEAAGFDLVDGAVRAVRLRDGSRIACAHAVNAAGPWARALAAAAGIDLPVHARRRTVFVLSCPTALPRCPLVVDPSGFWFRPEGRYFLAGAAPAPADDADDLPLEPNYAEFDEALWGRLAHRVPAFEALRVERAWAGYYDMNVFDHNAIVGAHPALPNLWFAAGFSGHGLQQAPAAGRALAELIVHGAFRSLDLAPLGFERLIRAQPLREANVIG